MLLALVYTTTSFKTAIPHISLTHFFVEKLRHLLKDIYGTNDF